MAALARCASILALSLVLSACGGGGGGGASPVPVAPAGHSGSAAIKFVVPTASSAARRRNIVPSTTQSIVVSATNPDGTQFSPAVLVTTNVTTTNCPAVSGGLSCTVDVTVPAATVLFSVAAYGSPNGAGALLALGQTTSAITGGANAVSITLSGSSQYTFTNLEGALLSTTLDHIAGTFTVSASGVTGSASGTFIPLANGDDELTITASTDPNNFTVGSFAYFRELPNAVLMFASPGGTSPPASGAEASGDMGAGVATSVCPTTSATTSFNLTTMAGSGFPSNVAGNQAFIVGTGTLASSTFSATGNAYTISGSTIALNGTGTTTCVNGVFSGSNVGAIAFSQLGAIVSADGATNGSGGQMSGGFGFVQPVLVNIASVASATYDGFTGGWSSGSSPTTNEAPFSAAPMGANTLQVCGYTDFVNNIASTTNCFTAVFNSQPFPGMLLGTAQGGSLSSPTPFVASVAQIEGKYVIFGLSASTANGAANFELMQH